jgi:hypothetical protein
VIIDRPAIVEKLLEYEFRLLSAKRAVVCSLLEAIGHCPDGHLTELIFQVIRSRPSLNLPIFHSFDEPYRLAIKTLNQKAKILRSLVNVQIQHEQHLGTQAGPAVPLFDRPAVFQTEYKNRMFDEGLLLNPFEVYESLKLVGDFLDTIPHVCRDFCESADIKSAKFWGYMEHAVLLETEEYLVNFVRCGMLPYDRAAFDFRCILSDSVSSTFTSGFVTRIETVVPMMANMSEGRKQRYLGSARRFYQLTWKLQSEVIKTAMLQNAYFEQCNHLGIGERAVLLPPFWDRTRKEGFIANMPATNDSIIDFAMSEVESLSVNFCSSTQIKDMIFGIRYSKLLNLLHFQRLQNAILEIVLRFNAMIIDSDFFVNYFGLQGPKSGPSVFLTSPDDAEVEREIDQTKYFRQFLAAQLFYQSTDLWRDNEIAHADKSLFLAQVRQIKLHARAILSGALKQREKVSVDTLMDLYLTEMAESFASYAYRVEIARICALESQILRSNAFSDTFALGPDSSALLVNEAGRFEKFFYVPTWVECVKMMQTANLNRQSDVLKPVSYFVSIRLQLLAFARFEAAMEGSASQAFQGLYNHTFTMETAKFQGLLRELGGLLNSRELDTSTSYAEMKLFHAYLRFENVLFEAIMGSFVDTGRKQSQGSEIATIDLWHTTKNRAKQPQSILTSEQYIPCWQVEFFSFGSEKDRHQLFVAFSSIDESIELAKKVLRNDAVLTSPELVAPLNDFLGDGVFLHHLKFAYILLLHRVEVATIDRISSVLKMTRHIYMDGLTSWNDVVLQIAENRCNPPGDDPLRYLTNRAPPVIKMHDVTIDVARQQIEHLLLMNQIKANQATASGLSSAVSRISNLAIDSLKPEFVRDADLLSAPSEKLFIIHPGTANAQFKQEYQYTRARFANMVYDALQSCAKSHGTHGGDATTSYSGDEFEEKCLELSTALNVFTNGSLTDLNVAWKEYLVTAGAQMRQNTETSHLVKVMGACLNRRFERHFEAEQSASLGERYLRLAAFRSEHREKVRAWRPIDAELEKDARVDFQRLLGDLQGQIGGRQSTFGDIRRAVYDHVAEKIRAAQRVEPEVDLSQRRLEESLVTARNRVMLRDLKADNDKLAQHLTKLRILRCMSQQSTIWFFKKRITAVEIDRRATHATFWQTRLSYESSEAAMEAQLAVTHRRLRETHVEIERLRQQLENEKLSNIQLVTWKAKNSKTIGELRTQIVAFAGIGDVNVGELIEKLTERHTVLDALRDEGDKFQQVVDDKVRKPVSRVERVRNKICETRSAKSVLLNRVRQQVSEREPEDTREMRMENAQLRRLNRMLEAEIKELELQKDQRSVDVRHFMEATVGPPPPAKRSNQKAPGIIIRPLPLKPNN